MLCKLGILLMVKICLWLGHSGTERSNSKPERSWAMGGPAPWWDVHQRRSGMLENLESRKCNKVVLFYCTI
jgi:hypothetical protein